jgi:hypothetical protein
MPKDSNRDEIVTDEEKRLVFQRKMREVAKRLAVNPELLAANIRFGLTSSKPPEEEHELAKAKGFQSVMAQIENEVLPQVKTRGNLEVFEKTMESLAKEGPSIARKQLESIKRSLPRGGGLGREPKLGFDQRCVACDEMASEIRRDSLTAKEAADRVSGRSDELFGTHVSTRTL